MPASRCVPSRGTSGSFVRHFIHQENTMTRSLLGSLAAALAIPLAAFTHAPVAVGPPWISIEYPVNPYDATTRDAFLQVNAYHHGTPVTIPVGGTAEGLVDGKRQSITLD